MFKSFYIALSVSPLQWKSVVGNITAFSNFIKVMWCTPNPWPRLLRTMPSMPSLSRVLLCQLGVSSLLPLCTYWLHLNPQCSKTDQPPCREIVARTSALLLLERPYFFNWQLSVGTPQTTDVLTTVICTCFQLMHWCALCFLAQHYKTPGKTVMFQCLTPFCSLTSSSFSSHVSHYPWSWQLYS